MIRYLIEDEENFNPLPMDTTEARKAVFEHFNVSTENWQIQWHIHTFLQISSTIELLKPLYEEFDKTHFAQLCARLAQCKRTSQFGCTSFYPNCVLFI